MPPNEFNERVWADVIWTQREGLSRTLRKHHITGIAISGTVGAGLFINSGEILALSGSLGAVISYLVAGVTVVCVMLCLSEMVSIRPLPGAFFEFPSLFVDESLGFAASWAYCCCTLTVQAALLLDYWHPTLPIAVAILVSWLPVVIFNFFGPVVWYGRLEWGVKWLKIFLIIGLSVLMIAVAAGLRGPQPHDVDKPSHQWNNQHRFPPGFCFDGAYNASCPKGAEDIPGGTGIFLGVWTSITTALFAFIGVEIVVIAAGEAKFPRHDLPIAARWIYWFAIIVYVLLMVFASLNVPYNDQALLPYSLSFPSHITNATTTALFSDVNNIAVTTGNRSPFIIALKRAGFRYTLPGFLNGCLFFAAITAANTAFYVSSRTLYQLCNGGKVHPTIKTTLGSTSYLGLPLWSVAVTVALSGFSFIGCFTGLQNEIVGVVSRISVTSILCVYVSQCVAFVRYQRLYKRHFRTDRRYDLVPGQGNCYRSGFHQPFPAIVAIVFGSLLIIFNGWDTIYRAAHGDGRLAAPQIAAGIIKSYFGPVLFVALFISHKIVHRTSLVNFHEAIDTLDFIADAPKDFDKEPLRRKARWERVLLEMR